jgi:hypothetical protein
MRDRRSRIAPRSPTLRMTTEETTMERPNPYDDTEATPEPAPDADPEQKTKTTVTPMDPDENVKDGIDVNET